MYDAAAPYLEGDGDPRRELHLALRRVVAVVNRDAPRAAARRLPVGQEDRMPPEWAPYIERFVDGAEARIARDQERGIAPDDIPPLLSAQALLAMVERHIDRRGDQGRQRGLRARARAGRAVVARGVLLAARLRARRAPGAPT